jgi:hypothetical protein
MNRLDSHLKRLMIWAGRASRPQPEQPPLGFSSRVVASWNPALSGSLLFELKRFAWASACVSLAVILGGAVVLATQAHAPEPATSLPSALSFLASNLTQ